MKVIDRMQIRDFGKSGGAIAGKAPGPSGSVEPMVTVITVVLNGRRELERTIRSVKMQTYCNMEYIVIDGGSTDGTVALLEDCKNSVDLWVSEPDRGISDAFNKGLRLASGDWMILLNAGDCFLREDAIESFAREFRSGNWVITAFARTEGGLMPVGRFSNNDDLRTRSLISHQATMVHRNVYERVGLYNTSYRIRMDYEFWLRALRRYDFTFIEDVLIDYAPNGVSANNELLYYLEEHRANMLRCANPKQFLGALIRYVKLLPEIHRLKS